MKLMHFSNPITAYFLPFAACLLLACACSSPSPVSQVSITGEIKGLGNDTLYLYGADRLYDRMDTLVTAEGQINATLQLDTLVAAWLRMPDGQEYPLFMQKGDKIVISGTAGGPLTVTGNPANAEMNEFQRLAAERGIVADEQQLILLADTFIRNHPASLVSVYLLERYFVQQPRADSERILQLAESMIGELQDRPYLHDLIAQLKEEENMQPKRLAPTFRVRNTEGKQKMRTSYKDQWLLIHFWASWDSLSRAENAGWRKFYKKMKKNKDFTMLGASLDTDRTLWLEAIEQDTLEWEQLCDLEGWNKGSLADKYAIHTLPSNVLLNPTGRIEGINLTAEEVEKVLKEATGKEK